MITKINDFIYSLTYEVPIHGTPPVNLYLIHTQQPILIDCGVGDEKTYNELAKDLQQISLTTKDLATILVTHHHVDHIGLAAQLAEESGAPIYLHPCDWSRVTATEEERKKNSNEFQQILKFWGLPEQTLQQIKEKVYKVLKMGSSSIPREKLTAFPEDKIVLGDVELEVIHCPGHTEGLVCLWWADKEILFASDHILENITPNTTVYIPRFRGNRCGLEDYLHSLSSLENLPAKTILPGHGTPFTDVATRVQVIREEAQKRREQIISLLKDKMTVLQLANELWKGLPPLQVFLALREVHGHLEILEKEQVIKMTDIDGVGTYVQQ